MFSTPAPVDGYSRVMIDLFDEREMISVSTGFLSFFGAPESGGRTVYADSSEVVDIDIIRGNEKTAALVQRGQLAAKNLDSKNASDQKYSSFSRVFPLGEEEDTITADQLNKRVAGEDPYAAQPKQDRLTVLASNNHSEHIRRFVRLFELLAAQAIITGKMDAILGTANVDLQYDFRRNAENIFSPAIAWDQATATIMADIDEGCDVVRKNGKVTPDMAIVGGGTMEAMIDNDAFQAKADNRRFELIEVSTNTPVPDRFRRFVESGFIARGKLRTAKGYELWLFTYIDGYTDENGDFVKYMPEDKMVIASSRARCDRYFGPGEIMPNNSQRLDMMSEMFGVQNPQTMSMPVVKNDSLIDAAMFTFDAYPHASNKGINIRTQAAPIFATTMTDAFVTIEDTLTP